MGAAGARNQLSMPGMAATMLAAQHGRLMGGQQQFYPQQQLYQVGGAMDGHMGGHMGHMGAPQQMQQPQQLYQMGGQLGGHVIVGANGVTMYGGGVGGAGMQMGGAPMQVAMVNGQPMMVQSSMMAPGMVAPPMAQPQAHTAQAQPQAQAQQPSMMAQQQAQAAQPAVVGQQAQPAMAPAQQGVAVMATAMPGAASQRSSAEEEEEEEVAEILGDAPPPPEEHEMEYPSGSCPAPFSRSQLAKPTPTSDEGAVFKEPGRKASSAVTFEDAHDGAPRHTPSPLTSHLSPLTSPSHLALSPWLSPPSHPPLASL